MIIYNKRRILTIMPSCQLCKREVDITFECNDCGQVFCEEHRLPEKHFCQWMANKAKWRGRKYRLKLKQE